MARMQEAYHRQADNPTLSEVGIPDGLKAMRRWMGTRLQRRTDGKIDKPPHRVREGRRVIKADKTNPENWATYDEALAALRAGRVSAIGFVFTDGDPFFVADLDGVIDPKTGEICEAAAKIIHALQTYTEISCSGTGVHVIGVGEKPEFAQCKSKALGFGVEVYDSKRFLVLTGRCFGIQRIEGRQEELEALCLKLWPDAHKRGSDRLEFSGPILLEDSEILDRARRSRTGTKFRKLFDEGDTSAYPSHSEADFSLLNMLVFWTAGDAERMARLFEMSALYRKDKHRSYVLDSVRNALASYRGRFYRPRKVDRARQEKPSAQDDPLAPYLQLMLNPSVWAGRRGASAYKAFTAAVILASESGIIDDAGDLRIGCDIRRLAEAAGTSFQTISASALPFLMQEMKVLKWKRGKAKKPGVLVLKRAACVTLNNKVRGYFIVQSCVTPKHAIETLRLLIRMRYGYSKSDTLLKLGMPAMFVAVALAAPEQHTRGYTAAELAERTGRRKSTLLAKDGPLKRLKAAGVVQETRDGFYRLTKEFASNYERALEFSGITYAEREQRRRHARDRKARDENLPTNKRPTRLRGRAQMERLLKKKREAAERKGADQERKKPREDAQDRIERFVRQGMSPKWARRSVLARGHPLGCGCEVCG